MQSIDENGVTFEEYLRNKAFYVGYTARSIAIEYLRWLTKRGQVMRKADGTFKAYTTANKNRPVLLWANGETITMTDAVEVLGFEVFEVYSSTLMVNARAVEDALQDMFQAVLPLGVRLWRKKDKGAKYDKEIVEGSVHKVFITCSPYIAQMLLDGIIKVDF